MSPAPLGFVWGCIWFGVFLIGHIAILHWRPAGNRSRVLIRGVAAALFASMITVAVLLLPEATAMLLAESYTIMAVGCLFVLYAPFFYLVHTSLSIESLVLLMGKGGHAPVGELTRRFASQQLLDGRLRTLVESGYLTRKGDLFSPTLRARRVTMAFSIVKVLWRLGAGG